MLLQNPPVIYYMHGVSCKCFIVTKQIVIVFFLHFVELSINKEHVFLLKMLVKKALGNIEFMIMRTHAFSN